MPISWSDLKGVCMKLSLIVGMLLVSSQVIAADKIYLIGENAKGLKDNGKVEALRALINNPKSYVIQCNQVELTDKATLRSK